MVDMQMASKEMEGNVPCLEKEHQPKYPYGLEINLNKESMEKLGLDKALPTIGQMLTLTAVVKVTSVRQEEEQKETCHYSTLQITAMELTPAKEQIDAKAMYPNTLMS